MKSVVLAAAAVIGLGSLTALTVAQHSEGAPTAATRPAATQPAAQAQPINQQCLVSGEDVDPDTRTVTYKGKTIGFCCDDCIAKFQKNPEKYMKNLKSAPSTKP